MTRIKTGSYLSNKSQNVTNYQNWTGIYHSIIYICCLIFLQGFQVESNRDYFKDKTFVQNGLTISYLIS